MGDSWEHVKELFHETRHLTTDQRRERLADVGADVRREVEQLIGAHREEPATMNPPGGAMVFNYETREAIAKMYEDWGKPEKSKEWRERNE